MREAQVDALVQESEIEPVFVLARTLRPEVVVSLSQVGRDARLTTLRGVDEITVTRAEENGLIEGVDGPIDCRFAARFSVGKAQLSEAEEAGLIGIPQRVREDPRQACLRKVVTPLGGAERRESIVADSDRQE